MVQDNSASQGAEEFVPLEIFISNDARRITEIVIDLIINFVIASIGVVSNTLVIIVYAKQGFRDSVGVSMTTISVWDLIKCLGGVMQRMAGPINLWNPVYALTWTNICLVVFNYLVSFSTYVTSVLAGYVAVERCLCVVFPLHIKRYLTTRVSWLICMLISVVVFGWFVVIFGIYDVLWVWEPSFNATIAIYRFSSFSSQNSVVLFGFYNLSGTIWPIISLLVIVSSAGVISSKLREASKFRQEQQRDYSSSSIKHAKQSAGKKLSTRDQKVMKMLLVIIAMFVINLSPRVVHYLAKSIVEDYYYLKKYHNLVHVVSYVILFFDFLNGSVNLAIFLVMSSSFRATFFQVIIHCRCTQKKSAY
ncbi:hypothetical protein BgiMline_035810 [Biomphalaria glabrata]|nr:neuropeptide receptor 15-like [Biomphalaria glabrata]